MNDEQISRINLLIMRFKEQMEAEGFTERSVEDYLEWLKYFVKYLQGTDVESLSDISRDTIHQYQMFLYNVKKKDGNPLSLGTQLCRLSIIRTFFRFLLRRGYLLYDPADSLELPRKEKVLPRTIMSKKEVFKLLSQPDCDTPLGLRDKTILEVLYSTGIRNSELTGLAVFDIDISNQELRVRQGKGRKDRALPLGGIAARYLDEYIRVARPHFIGMRDKYVLNKPGQNRDKLERENSLLFFSYIGKKLSRTVLSSMVRHYARKAKLTKRTTPHGIRHTFATHMLRGKASIRHIQEMLGHACLETTQLYTQVELSDLKKEHKRCHPREQNR